MEDKLKINDFDDVLPYIGGFGPFQYVIFGALCTMSYLYGLVYYGQIFMTLTPPHWCSAPPELGDEIWDLFGRNLTQDELRHLTIPRKENRTDYEECLRYDIAVNQINISNFKFEPNLSWPTTRCNYGWEYDYEIYYPSLTSQMNWVCDEDWKVPSAQAFFLFGALVGSLGFGWLADVFGRIPAMVAINVTAGVFGVASSFCSSFTLFCILRFFVGLAYDSGVLIMYVLSLEYASVEYRTIVGNAPFMVFLTASLCSLPWIAYSLHDWTVFGTIIHLPSFLAVFLPWYCPESVRWLLCQGKCDRAVEIVKNAAKTNKKHLSEECLSSFKEYAENMSRKEVKVANWHDLLKTPRLRKRFVALCFTWVALFVVSDGIVRQSVNVGSNIFISFSLIGLVEFPGDLLSILSMDYLGRKYSIIGSLLLCGAVLVSALGFLENTTYTMLALAVFGRCFSTVAINVALQYINEILPTVARVQGLLAIQAIGLGVGFVSPYIVYSSKFNTELPYIIFTFVCICGAGASLILPETKGEKLPDSLEDGEEYLKNQSVFHNPWKRRNSKTEHTT